MAMLRGSSTAAVVGIGIRDGSREYGRPDDRPSGPPPGFDRDPAYMAMRPESTRAV